MIKPNDVYLPSDTTNDNVCALFLAGLRFFACSHPWEPEHAKFSVITFIVIIGCFSSCIKARRKVFLSYFEQVNDFELSILKIKKTSCCIPEKFISVIGIIKHLIHMS